MASNNSIVKKSIQIDAGDTVRTVRSLKQEISDLRDQLLNLEQGTEEYDAVQKQLQEDVEDLNTVMGAHKEKAEVLEGSYNDLQNQLKELKKAWKETNDEAERDVIGQQINELNNKLKEMDASIGDFHRNVGNYQSAWQGLSGVMDKSEKITDDLEKGIKAFGTALGLTEKEVKGLSDVLKRMKDGFKIAKDIAKAKESTEKLATAEKVAAAQGTALATSQKATAVAASTMATSEAAASTATKGLSVAMGGLKAALISTGIGALIVLLGQLVAMLDKVALKIKSSRDAAFQSMSTSAQLEARFLELQTESLKNTEKILDHEVEMNKARGQSEKELLEQRKKNYEDLEAKADQFYRDALAKEKAYREEVEKMSAKQQERNKEEIQKTLEYYENATQAAKKARESYWESARQVGWDIEVLEEEAKHIKATTEELKKWSDLVKDQKFQTAWKGIFEVDYGDKSPVDVLKAQMNSALALVNKFKGETREVEQFFQKMIADAEAEWQSLVEKEQQIFDERLTPAQRLENEKQEWIEKAERWGKDATEIVKYYDKKIQEELDKAEEERQTKLKEEQEKYLQEIETFLSQVDATLNTQERMDELFNPVFVQDTASGDIDQEVEAIQRLYDTQMSYLNKLLESADLTEEAYEGIEERILSLTVAFNSQMNVLKKEQDYQGKNWALLSRKGVASFNLMEDAASDFASAFQSLGLENSAAFKGFASAQAMISALLAANRVLAEEPGPFALKAVAAAAALAAGIANVVSIWAVDPDGSNVGSSMNANMNLATPVIGNAQPLNYVSNVTNAEEEDRLNQPIYVTVTDIEDGINGHRANVINSSF